MIPFNRPYVSGYEVEYIKEVIDSKNFAGDATFSKMCTKSFRDFFGFDHAFLTTSCSSSLDIISLLCDFSAKDEIIIPSFGYVTSASVFEARGANIIFCDSENDNPNISVEHLEKLITKNTKALLIVHYAGSACNMDAIMRLVRAHNLILIEDCAQAIGAKYKDRFLGSFGHFSAFSFHETKNIQCGEGGLLVVNDPAFVNLAHTVWQEGTNKHQFEEGLVKKYEWVSLGSSYQTSELNAAFLYGQLRAFDTLHETRRVLWTYYYKSLALLEAEGFIQFPKSELNHNAHIFYFKVENEKTRTELLSFLQKKGITATFHYYPLHLSKYWIGKNNTLSLQHAESWSNRLVRLPLFASLEKTEQDYIVTALFNFFGL